MKRLSLLFTLLITLLILLAGCDNGSVSDSAMSETSGLVNVSLTVDGESSSSQKTISLEGLSYIYQYKAVPKWTQSKPIHGSTNGQYILIPNYSPSAPTSLGYFAAGEWEFHIRVLNGSTPVYEGQKTININSSQSSVTVEVAKIIQDATPGVVSITVTVPTVKNDDELTVSWSGTASGSGSTSGTPSGGLTTFTYTKTNLPVGIYTFTLSHNNIAAGGETIAVDLHQGEMAIITGQFDGGEWQLSYINVQLYSIAVERYEWEDHEYYGTVDLEIDSAVPGDRVSFYARPITNSSVNTLSITCGGNPVAYTRQGNLYSFIMPEGNVNVYVKFENVDSELVNTMLFKTLVHILYNENRATVTTFGKAAGTPGVGDHPTTLNDVKIWYDSTNHKICWYSDTDKVNLSAGSLADLFSGCDKYTSISMDGIVTSRVTDMARMFQGCTGLTSLTLSSFNASSATDVSSMFQGCTGLTSLNIANFNASNATNISNMFQGCSNLTSLTITGLTTSSTSGVNMAGLFKDCSKLSSITLPATLYTNKAINLAGFFQGCSNLSGTLNLTNFNASSATDVSNMFQGCSKLTGLTLTGFTLNTTSPVNMQAMFKDCEKLAGTLNLSSFNTIKANDMSFMFCGCYALTSINFGSNFNTSNVTDMSYMFSSGEYYLPTNQKPKKMNFRSLNVSGFDTSKVTNMSHMFFQCSNNNLTTLDVSGFRTPQVTDMSSMFACYRDQPSYVTAINMSGWDFTKVTTVNRMFDRCQFVELTFPTQTKLYNIEDILYWFSHCFALDPSELKTIVRSFDFSQHTNITALQALLAKNDDNNGEAEPNNRLTTNDMDNYKTNRDIYPTHTNNTVITNLYYGGNNLSNIKYQRLTTDPLGYTPPTP